MSIKFCYSCKETKSLFDFYNNRSTKDGKQGICKLCCKTYRQSEKGKETQRKGNAKYRKSEKGKIYYSEYGKKYRQSEKCKESKRRYYTSEKGRQVYRRLDKKRYWSDPEYHILKSISHRYKVYIGTLKTIRERDKNCKNCGSDEKLEFDHIIPVSKGGKGTLENLQILCRPCNASKGNKV